ncbi:gamma-glutamyl-gamma-aminobutyrate hydrolase family protein [Cupriavidus sp. AcVe19-1a]|uniref:gamma-glutamyl-gamma-aminobutyrate hydrolase family protein n=1 Tax=Cupriavidus sp. AcVe19-1a TaxID=2821359 RepID=UPI001AE88878|nr:gamma-glutamyl-gamma-aminobutyrate hydrolase family protein [Cupriavidus sp. AcVe19-1a]MBP0633146.1 gamma-glutamyl-gamma-aminobutyrate hydrolase family protein [Cupriavidus sp. AcVe19-1a]
MSSFATSPRSADRPLVGVVCDRFFVGDHDLHSAKESYRRALSQVAAVTPVLIPAAEDIEGVAPYLDAVSGLLLPGGASNVAPGLYGGTEPAAFLVDPARDSVAMSLIQGAIARGMPILAICRGFQEMNVALGGTLHPDIYDAGHATDHREDPTESMVERYRYKHIVTLAPDGLLRDWIRSGSAVVNSLHTQGIRTLGQGLSVEASHGDGLVEAIRVKDAPFAIGVQWHPEVTAAVDPLSQALFSRFGDACRYYAGQA